MAFLQDQFSVQYVSSESIPLSSVDYFLWFVKKSTVIWRNSLCSMERNVCMEKRFYPFQN